MTIILTGGMMGTLMWFNVWFIIWPAQKVVIASAEQVAAGGEPIAEAACPWGSSAGMASRTNTMFSIPMLFFMGAASHLQGLMEAGGGVLGYWAAALVVIVLVEINGVIKPGSPTQKPLTSVGGVISAGFALTIILFLVAQAFLSAS